MAGLEVGRREGPMATVAGLAAQRRHLELMPAKVVCQAGARHAPPVLGKRRTRVAPRPAATDGDGLGPPNVVVVVIGPH